GPRSRAGIRSARAQTEEGPSPPGGGWRGAATPLMRGARMQPRQGGNVMKLFRQAMAAIAVGAALGALPAAAETAKNVVRIHTAGPNDLGVETTMLAWIFANYVNTHSNSVEVRVFPNSQLGQTRDVIEAMRLGSGASGTTGGPAEYASFVKRLGVL